MRPYENLNLNALIYRDPGITLSHNMTLVQHYHITCILDLKVWAACDHILKRIVRNCEKMDRWVGHRLKNEMVSILE